MPYPGGPRVAIVEPIWTSYRYPVYQELAERCRVDWIFSQGHRESGFGTVVPPHIPSLRYLEVPMRKPFGESLGLWQAGIVRYVLRERPDIIMFSANPRSASFWTTLFLGRLLGIPVYGHGHGVYKKVRISWPYRRMMNLLLRLSAAYIAYAPIVRDTFEAQGFSLAKVQVASNSVMNLCPVHPEEKTGKERGVLFLGRLRPGCGLDVLVNVIRRLRDERLLDLELHVIGSGQNGATLRGEDASRPWIHWHGEIYDDARIREISRECFAGCYPGNAGLSVVHMMSLSLPVVVHGCIALHQGPEPAFVIDGRNGILFDRAQAADGIFKALHDLATNVDLRKRMAKACDHDYASITNPSLAQRLLSILRGSQHVGGDELTLKATP